MTTFHSKMRAAEVGFAALLFIFLALARPASAQAPAGDIRVISSIAAQKGAQMISFSLQAESAGTIDRVTLLYGYSGHGCNADGTRWPVPVKPDTKVLAVWDWDTARMGGYLPWVELWWQWEIHDQSGQSLLTEKQTLLLMDQNHFWRKLEQGQITLYWYEGSQAYGERLMNIAVKSWDRLTNQAGLKSTNPMRLVIYPSAEEMRNALGDSNEWVGGAAIAEYDLILMGIPPTDPSSWSEEVIPHEIAHLIIETGFVDCQAIRLPLWLNEGIARYAEGPVTFLDNNLVKKALGKDSLPALKSMRYSFPAEDDEAMLAYAQSVMVVTYMIDQHGIEKMNALVEAIRGGQSIDQALRTIYGLNTDELDRTWRATMGYGEAPTPHFATETPRITNTPYATKVLRPSVWNPNATPTPTATVTSTPLPTATPTATVSPALTAVSAKQAVRPWRTLVIMMICCAFAAGVLVFVAGAAAIVVERRSHRD